MENGKIKPYTKSIEKKEEYSANGSVSFNMENFDACAKNASEKHFFLSVGPLLDYGAPYSGIGEQ